MLRRKYNEHPTDSIKFKIKESESSLLTKITDAKTNYENNLVTTFANKNNSKIYKFIKNITKSHSNLHLVLLTSTILCFSQPVPPGQAE